MHENIIKKLTEREAVRQTPWVYVGACERSEYNPWTLSDGVIRRKVMTFCPAILKLVDEIVSNSIDESFKTGHKSGGGRFTIWVNIDDQSLTVRDNGRGIPLTIPPDREIQNIDGSVTVISANGKTAAEIALTELNAGSNFEVKEYASIGAHGKGSTLVNILSRQFEAVVVHKDKKLHLKAIRGETILSKLSDASGEDSGTTITFHPDWQCFGDVSSFDKEHTDLIQRRIVELAACLPMITFKFNGRVVQSRDFSSYVKMISPEKSFEEFVGPHVRLAVCTSDEPEQISFINGIDTYAGGSHIEHFRGKIAELVTERLRRKHKFDLKPQDIKNRLCFVLMTNSIMNPRFKGQTKEFLDNKASDFASLVFQDFDFEKFAKKISENEDLMSPILDYFRLRQRMKDLEEERKKKKKLAKMDVAEHLPANHPDWTKRILFVTEGESAIGRLQEVRDPKVHGGFPLRGKPINVRGMTVNELLDNVEFKKVSNIMGLVPGEDYSTLEYGTLALMADADHDGNSIMGLLLNMFSMWPKLFEEKRVRLCLSPVLKWEKGKTSRIYYTMGEYNEDRLAGNIPANSTITYLKGLGSLTVEEYRQMIVNPRFVTIEHDPSWKETLQLVFGEDSTPRKTWLS